MTLYTQHPIDYRGNSPRFEYRPVTDEAFDEVARERGYVKAPQLSNGPSRYLGRRYMETHPAESLRYLLDVDVDRLRTDLQVAELVGAKTRLGDSYMMIVARQVLSALDGETP